MLAHYKSGVCRSNGATTAFNDEQSTQTDVGHSVCSMRTTHVKPVRIMRGTERESKMEEEREKGRANDNNNLCSAWSVGRVKTTVG